MAESARTDSDPNANGPDTHDSTGDMTGPTTQFLIETPAQTEVPRERWSFKWEFGFTAVAFLVEPGLLLKIPFLMHSYSGISFILVYAFFLVIFALPMFYMEICLGQFCGKGLAHTWTFAPLFRGIGVGMSVVCGLFTLMENAILSWDVHYLFTSFMSSPWASCSNEWNTKHCSRTWNSSVRLRYEVSPSTEYFEDKVLNLSSSRDEIGSLQWPLVGCLLFAMILIFLTLFWGVRVLGKVATACLVLIVLFLVVLLLRSVTLDGSGDGLRYLMNPSSQGLADAKIWFTALTSAFYSTAVSTGAIHTLASYKNFQSTIFRDACFIVGTKILLVFIVSITIFGFAGFASTAQVASTFKIFHGGVLIVFESLPSALSFLPVSRAWNILLFLTVFLTLMTSQFVHFEVMVTMVQDILPQKGHKVRALVTAAVCGVIFILTLPLLTQGGFNLFILFWHGVYIVTFPVLLLLECVTVGWLYGLGQFSNDVKMMTGKRPPVIFKPIWCFLIPIAAIIILIVSAVHFLPPDFYHNVFGIRLAVVGWLILLLPLAPVHLFFLWALVTRRTPLVTPSPDWKPADPEFRSTYTNQRITHRSFGDRLRDIFSA